MHRIAWLLAGLAAALPAVAQQVSLNGSMGERAALLVIDGQPRTLTVGSSHGGVKLLSVAADGARVEVGGSQLLLRIGAAPVNLGGAGAARTDSEVVLTAGPGGHFMSGGQINGKTVQFMVDTGASVVALSQAEADRIGLDYKRGPRGMTQTANGPVPVHQVVLTSVRVGGAEVYQVPAVVLPEQMPFVLLGNSFLSRFQMKQVNDTLRLEKKP
ncbi:retroviral-like aspartic protease family protein [Aquincola tertiaricarbonis]|uniref:Retroviral-like aspartic protease family protein n=1 Tax=Aquincola tertiaricarbonis TaxID=391953 RepID=A0ABY4SGI9_AQUTE|nr:retropepsin-like aspartic protease [Aquincola tertiaricarbonis]URI10878.1 retroviral-like aspartic protease family protein [Aquincola tertiaricarbonis]